MAWTPQTVIDLFKLLIIFNVGVHSATGYRRDVLQHEINDDFACNNQTCDGRPHSSCLFQQPVHKKNCADSKLMRVLTLSRGDIRMLLHGHNGLRNRVALTLNPPVANMNLLHWDENLQQMAEGWIKQCTINTDSCEFIHDPNITVGQNIRFEYAEQVPARWIVQVVKHWFLEELLQKSAHWTRTNNSQMIWPEAEFIGCAAAQYVNGYFLVCNYHPIAEAPAESMFKRAERACSECPDNRPGCSRIFNGLCGIDIDSTARLHSNMLTVFVLLIVHGTFCLLV